jgi:hypothetical protein
MNRVSFVLIVLLGASLCFGQAATSGAPAATPNAAGHGAFPVKVMKTMDSSKLKDGDAIEVETAGSFKLPDGTLVPKGSRMTGHVTASKARSKGDSDSQLTMTFDKLDIANGKLLPIKGAVQAVFPPQDNPDPQMAGSASIAAGGGIGSIGSVPTKSGSNTQADATAQPTMTPKSVGVQGIHDLELTDGVLSSKGKNVKLGGGVRMIVRVDILG